MFSANVLSENAGQVQMFKNYVHVAKIIDLSSLCFHPKTVGNGWEMVESSHLERIPKKGWKQYLCN